MADNDRGFHTLTAALIAAVLAVSAAGCGGTRDRVHARLDLKNGNLAHLAGDHRQAIEHYDRAIARVPTHARAHLNRAYSWIALFRASVDPDERRALADSAAASLDRYRALADEGYAAASRGPSAERVEQHVLTLYLESAQLDRASAILEARLRDHPRDMATVQMLANLATDRGDVDAALHWHRRRIELEPGDAEGLHALAVTAWQFSHHDVVPAERRAGLLDEGVRAAERAVELRPDYFEALIYANLLWREKAEHATDAADRAECEKRYLEYEERARQARERQNDGDVSVLHREGDDELPEHDD